MDQLGRIPPQAIEIERAILGALLLEDAIHKVDSVLKADMFYVEAHQYVYEAILNLSQSSSPIDMLTVTRELKRMGRLEEIGGMLYITQLTSHVAAAAHIEGHAREVVECSVKRSFINIASEIYAAAFSDSVSIDDLIGMTHQLDIGNLVSGSGNVKSLKDNAHAAVAEIKAEVKKAEDTGIIGVPTPLPSLNAVIGGFEAWVIIIAGRPGMGKTQMALFFAKFQSMNGFPAAFFSLEMTTLSLMKRLLLSETGISGDRMIQRKLNHQDIKKLEKAADNLSQYDIWVDDKSSHSLTSIKSKVIELKRKGKCEIVYIDYLQITDMTNIKGVNKEAQTGEAMRIAKTIAKDIGIPVVILSQLNRTVESTPSKRPNMSHLRDSGAIEQDADLILFPHRAAYYGIMEDEQGMSTQGVIELIMGKFRHGNSENIFCTHNDTLTEFYDNHEVPHILPEQPKLDFHGDQPYQTNDNEECPALSGRLDFGS